jgi:mono/diheme cytochrome c family protein
VKTVLKVVGGVLLLIICGVAAFVGYVSATWDKDYSATPRPAVKASTDPEVIRRGEYLAHSVAHCSVCHVPEDVTAKREPGEHPAMVGGFVWRMGPLGTITSRNITPDKETGIGNWTDEDLARAIKFTVGRDGKLLPFMSLTVPAMADEDVEAIISYLRSTQPTVRPNTPPEPGILLKYLATKVGPSFREGFLKDLKYVAASEEPSLERGKYLAHGPGWCVGCHSPFNMLEMKPSGPQFSGSSDPEPDHKDASMVFRIPNLTTDPETGHMANWDEDHFVARFKAGRAIASSKMPWEAYREMTDSDLRSIFRYLKTVPPTKNYVGPTWRKKDEDPAKDALAKSAALRK